MGFSRDDLQARLADLAGQGVYVGTSSWKYAGWCGMLYESQRYEYRGKFAESRFSRNCLAEYSEVFKTVCVDAAYYSFPTERYLTGMAEQVSEDFRFAFKVTDLITLKNFPNLPKFGNEAGKANKDYLNAELFERDFLGPCRGIRGNVGILIFEFSRFWPADYQHGRDFLSDLDQFLRRLPTGWPYGVEIRNRFWLKPGYFECLSRHGVTHVFNSWEAMPPVAEQMQMDGSRTNPEMTAARFLLKPGRQYEEAVRLFKPYDVVKEELPAERAAGKALVREGAQRGGGAHKTFIYVNNRLEGNALSTIQAIIEPQD